MVLANIVYHSWLGQLKRPLVGTRKPFPSIGMACVRFFCSYAPASAGRNPSQYVPYQMRRETENMSVLVIDIAKLLREPPGQGDKTANYLFTRTCLFKLSQRRNLSHLRKGI